MSTRKEHDLLGERDVPADAYWGIHSLRARENFPISGTPIGIFPDLVHSLALVKHAAALANRDLGEISAAQAQAIVTACEEISGGALHEQFVVDVIQGGAGTSTNMNANEVIANRGLELLGRQKGDYSALHPIEHRADMGVGPGAEAGFPLGRVGAGHRHIIGVEHRGLADLCLLYTSPSPRDS